MLYTVVKSPCEHLVFHQEIQNRTPHLSLPNDLLENFTFRLWHNDISDSLEKKLEETIARNQVMTLFIMFASLYRLLDSL